MSKGSPDVKQLHALISALLVHLAGLNLGDRSEVCYRNVAIAAGNLMGVFACSDQRGQKPQKLCHEGSIVYALAFFADGINSIADSMVPAGNAATSTLEDYSSQLCLLFDMAESLRLAHLPHVIRFAIDKLEHDWPVLCVDTYRRRALDKGPLAHKRDSGVPVVSTVLWLFMIVSCHIVNLKAAQQSAPGSSSMQRCFAMAAAFERIATYIKVS